MTAINWAKYAPYFTKAEFDCKHTGRNEMKPEFMDKLLDLRIKTNMRMNVTSGFRDPSRPEEARKGHGNGEHTKGCCCDVAVNGEDAYTLIGMAIEAGFTRIGVSQKPGVARFVHLGIGAPGLPSPRIWSY